MKEFRFEVSHIRPNKTYGRWGYDDIHSIQNERVSFDLHDFILDIEGEFPDFIERWEDILSDSISDYIDDIYPPDEKIQRYHTPGRITYVFDCDLYRGDELITQYHAISTFVGEKDIKDVLTEEWKIWRRDKRISDLGI